MPVVANGHNIVIQQGDTFNLDITWKDKLGVAIDITNYTARMEVRAAHNEADSVVALIALTSAVGGSGNTSGIALGGVAGTIAIVISDTDTEGLTAPATNVYDLELIAADGSVTRVVEGSAAVSPNVTKSTYTG